MHLQLFLNELSVPNEQLAHAVSISYLKQLVATVRRAQTIDAALVLNSDIPLGNFPLGKEVTIASIRNNSECVEESTYLKTIKNRAPFALTASEFEDKDPDSCEYRIHHNSPIHAHKIALGLGFAHLFSGLSLSLPSHNFWKQRSIELHLTKLCDFRGFINEQVIALNADSPTAISHHENALQELLTPQIATGAELWERRSELFPNLVFIPRTQAQLENILAGDPMLKQAWIKLSGIDRAIGVWKVTKGPHPMFPFNVRPESRSRRALAKFKDADGLTRTFSEHCDLAPTEGRIHFIIETEPRTHALIGHIGRKLGIG